MPIIVRTSVCGDVSNCCWPICYRSEPSIDVDVLHPGIANDCHVHLFQHYSSSASVYCDPN